MNEAKDPTGRITQAELARRLKVSRPSVSKAVKAGRITPDEDGLFDPLEAELQWVSNTRPSARGKRKPAAGGYAEARGRKETALARMAELRLAQAEGELLQREDVDFVMNDLGATWRGLMENLADRLAPIIYPLTTLEDTHTAVREMADEIMFELAEALERRSKELHAGTNPAA